MHFRFFVFITIFFCAAIADPVLAQEQALSPQKPPLLQAAKLSIARDFVQRMTRGFSKADQTLRQAGFAVNPDMAPGLPEGEELLLRMRLKKDRIYIDTPMLARVYNQRVLFSFRDFTQILELAIEYDSATRKAEGWYLRENKLFSLDYDSGAVKSEQGTFRLSSYVRLEDDDLYIPLSELGKWFGFNMDLDVSKQEILYDSPVQLPIQERLARQKRLQDGGQNNQPQLPLLVETPKTVDFPFVDVATYSRLAKDGDTGEKQNSHRATVRTAGDFVGGTLTTQTQLEKEDKLQSFRINYKQESLEPELLGPLAARRYELGDVNSVNMPLDSLGSQGTGVRVTNIHPLRTYLRPSTEITGDGFPGWDVELYRDGQLLRTKTIGEDGIYRFDNVELYRADNNFKLVFYGPQGEQREEDIYIPVDNKRLSEMGSAYDISINRQDSLTYTKEGDSAENEDEGAPNLSAIYETPINDSTALSLGLESGSRDGNQVGVAHAGISTTLAETLLNLNTAIENNGEMAAEMVARRNIGDHELRNETIFSTEKFGVGDDADGLEVFSNQFNVNGPLDFDIGTRKPRYNLTFDYGLDADGNNSFDTTAGISSSFRSLALNQQFRHSMNDQIEDDTLNSITTVSGSLGRNRVRLSADYEMMPENKLDYVTANFRRYLDQDVELDLTVDHRLDPKFTEGRAQVNWWAGFAHLSPGVSYNSDNDMAVTLNTRFGMAKDPLNGDVRMFDRSIVANGGISAFVFLDKDGNGQFNEGDEPIPDAIVRTPQNSGREITDEGGYAFFNRLANMRVTDVFVDPESLKDPFWIPGYQGASIIPREGHVTTLSFPIHNSGEVDGTVYVRLADGTVRPQRGIIVSLYNLEGKKTVSAISETDGFYLLSKIPPGDYFLTIDTAIKEEGYARPAPQPIKIGYDGTTIYDNKIYIDQGKPDVGYAIMANAETITPDTSKLEGRKYVLNLGSYNSRVMMVLAWYKMKTVHGAYLAGAQLIDKPSESFVNSSGQHVLRVVVPSNALPDAERRCRGLAARDQSCTVEILPAAAPRQVSAETLAKQG